LPVFQVEVWRPIFLQYSVMRKTKHLKDMKIFWALIFLGYLLPSSLSSRTPEAKWIQGYKESVRGGTIDYHSPQPDVTQALIVRSLNAEDFIEWETDPVPLEYRGEFVNFIWIFGMDVDIDPQSYDLFIDGKKYFSFSNPQTDSCREWALKGPGEAELRFRATLTDRHGDIFGYASLRMPAASVKPGRPLHLRVVGKTAGSRVWYMTFQSQVEEGIEVIPQQALIRRGQNLFQPIDVHIIHLGEPMEIELSAPGQTPVKRKVIFGFNRIEMTFPDVTLKTELSLSVRRSGREPVVKNFFLSPVRRWFVYLVQHTHTDIGYTRPQSEILPEHLRFIDYALDFCDLTDGYPDDARFRWTCEASWAVDQYLKNRPPEQIERLERRIRGGSIELTGMPFNMSEIADENLYAEALRPVKRFKSLGLPVKLAMQNDVNGIAWCLADYFPLTGVEYLIMGQHGHRARIPFDKPTAFWWESPSGNRLLAFRADHYMTGNFWGIHTGNFESVEREVMQYLKDLATREYPYDRIAVQYSGYYTDNSPPSTAGSDIIKRWNEKYEWPKLRSAVSSEFPEYIKSKMGDKLPVYRVAWPDWWSDGFGSAALETAAARKTQDGLIASEGLLSMTRLLGMAVPSSSLEKINKICNALLFWDEHTMGAAESIREPLVENSVVQWAEKSAYVWEASKDLRLFLETCLGLLQSRIPRQDVPVIAVFNTLNWSRSGQVEVYIDHQILPPGRDFRLVDSKGKEIFSQFSQRRADGTYWQIRVEDIPPFGYKVYRLELLDRPAATVREIGDENYVFENDFYRLKIDARTGAISGLLDKRWGTELIDKDSPWHLGQFIHETISNRSQLEQLHLVSCQRQTLRNVSIQNGVNGPLWKCLRITGETPTAEENSPVRLEIRLFHHEKRIELHYSLIKKDITDPEAIYIAFPFDLPQAEVLYEGHGSLIFPGKNQLEGTSSDWHTIQRFTALRNREGQIILGSEDVPLVQFGDLNLGKFQYLAQVKKPHVFSWVMNNYWVTNFKASQEGEFKWSYFICSGKDSSSTTATRIGWNSSIPLVGRVLPAGKASGEPEEQSLLNIGAANVLLVSSKLSTDAKGIILHLRETEGRPVEFYISIPVIPSEKCSIEEVNVLEEMIGEIRGKIKLKAWESKFIKVAFDGEGKCFR
jgi:alpha-mannosidase